MDLGRKFHFDEAHSTHVADLCLQIYDQTEAWHGLDARYRLLLEVAALLHEVGLVVSTRNHHKHSMYLIINSELFGLGRKDLELVALIARYHRRAAPKPTHPIYSELDRETRILVSKLAAILRVADSLDRMHDQHIRRLHCRRRDDRLVLEIADVEDLTLENMALKQKGGLFEMVYGCEVEFQLRSLTVNHGSGIHPIP
jgi:exopolyphosphatase/guanosine-5'-triphosphate,3'-diphosphate pyrophosphatase